MKKIAHYIITRFNLRSAGLGTTALDPAWLRRRFDLFEKFCLPTVKAQALQDFSWLILFDNETPADARRKISEWANWPAITPVFMEAGAVDVGRRAVALAMQEPPDLLLTTRLDNDDGLALDYIKTIRSFAEVDRPTVLEFPNGYVLAGGRAYLDHQPRNPFSTLVEPVERNPQYPYKTIYHGAHHQSQNLGQILEVSQAPGWLQVVHGGNLANRVRGIRKPVADLRNRFALDPALLTSSEGGIEFAFDAVRTRGVEALRQIWRRIR